MIMYKETRQILRTCAKVFFYNTKLFLFPIISISIGFLSLIALAYIFHLESSLGWSPITWVETFQAFINSIIEGDSFALNLKFSFDAIGPRLWIIIPLIVITLLVDNFFRTVFCVSVKRALNGQKITILSTTSSTLKKIVPLTSWLLYQSTVGLFRQLAIKRGGLLIYTFSRLDVCKKGFTEQPNTAFDKNVGLIKNIPPHLYQKLHIAGASSLIILHFVLMIPLLIFTAISAEFRIFYEYISLALIAFAVLFTLGMLIIISMMTFYKVALYIFTTEGAIPSPEFTELFEEA